MVPGKSLDLLDFGKVREVRLKIRIIHILSLFAIPALKQNKTKQKDLLNNFVSNQLWKK